MLDACEYAHFVESVLLLLVRQLDHFYFFEGVDLAVGQALHLVDGRVGSFTYIDATNQCVSNDFQVLRAERSDANADHSFQ